MPHFHMLSSGQPTPCHTFLFGCLDSSATLCQTFVSVRLSCGRGSRAPSPPSSLLCPLRRETGSFKLNTRAEQRTGVLEAERRSENRGEQRLAAQWTSVDHKSVQLDEAMQTLNSFVISESSSFLYSRGCLWDMPKRRVIERQSFVESLRPALGLWPITQKVQSSRPAGRREEEGKRESLTKQKLHGTCHPVL